MKKRELLERIKGIEITYDYEATYDSLYYAWCEYANNEQEWDLEYLFSDYCSAEKDDLECLKSDLVRELEYILDNEGEE